MVYAHTLEFISMRGSRVTIMLTLALSVCRPRHTDWFILRPTGFRTGALNYVK